MRLGHWATKILNFWDVTINRTIAFQKKIYYYYKKERETMAYKRRSSYRAKRTKRARKPRSSLASQAISAISGYALKRLKQKLGLNTETNFIDVAGTTTSSTSLAQRINFATIPQGDGVGNRHGCSIRISKVETRIHIAAPAASTVATTVRIIQVRNTRASNALPVDILESITDITSPLNNTYRDMGIQLLKDTTVVLGVAGSAEGAVYLHWTHTGLDDQVVYPDTDTAGAPGSVLKGVITTYWYADNSTNAPLFTSKCRYWYVDN